MVHNCESCMPLNTLRRNIRVFFRYPSSIVHASAYQHGKRLFWLAVGVVVIAAAGVLVLEAGYSAPYISNIIYEPTDDFFVSSLTLILTIISLVFIIVIFLVQNANQEYSSRLSSVILGDRYFLATIGFVLVGSTFSISGSYFELGAPFTLIGFAFSIGTILLVGALIAFAGYFINIPNIIDYTAREIENEITSNRIYKSNPFNVPLQDEEYIARLTSQTQLIVSTCIKGIEQNHQPVVESSLDALERITDRFLDETTEGDVDENLLQELNDQFQFIGSASFEDYSRQKHSERVAETIGNIGVAITKSRELGSPGALWAKLLEKMFSDSLEFDRTKAASISIQKLGEMSVAAIIKGDDSVRSYQSNLENISTVCAAANHPYLAGLLQTLHGQYQDMYAAYLHALLSSGHVADYDVQTLFEDFAESFNQAKANYDHYNTQIVYAGVFGLKPFAGAVAVPLMQHNDIYPRTQQYFEDYLEELIKFLRNISLQNVDENYPDIYKGYTQFLFVLEQTDPLDQDANKKLISRLNNAWLDLISKTYNNANKEGENVDHHLHPRMSDFTALLIYFHNDDPQELAELIEPMAETYRDIEAKFDRSENHVDRNQERLYQQLKLAGAWINRFHDLQSITPQLWDILVDDFREIPENHSKIPRQLLPKYGYPTDASFSRDRYWLRPDTLWEYTGFQDDVAETLNGEDGSHYAEFHECLAKEQ